MPQQVAVRQGDEERGGSQPIKRYLKIRSAWLQDRSTYPKTHILNLDPRGCRISPLIFLLGSSTDEGVCSLFPDWMLEDGKWSKTDTADDSLSQPSIQAEEALVPLPKSSLG